MLLRDLIKQGASLLEKSGILFPRKEAQYILASILEKDFLYLVVHDQQPISQEVEALFFSYIKERGDRKPFSKIMGKRFFYGHEINVSLDTLDPRPESETLIDAVLEDVDEKENIRILDLGTGSGCLILALLYKLKNAQGLAVDISGKALKIAEENAKKLGLLNRVDFIKSDWMQALPTDEKFDIVISNPPYIAENTIETLDPEVKLYDPYLALNGGSDGLMCYRCIAKEVFKNIKNKTKIFFEIGAGQENEILYIMKKEGYLCEREFYDLSGRVRCLKFKKASFIPAKKDK